LDCLIKNFLAKCDLSSKNAINFIKDVFFQSIINLKARKAEKVPKKGSNFQKTGKVKELL